MENYISNITNPNIINAADNCKDLYFSLFNSLTNGLCLLEICGSKVKGLYLNERFFDVIGYTKEQYYPYIDNVTVTFFEEDEQRFFACINESIEKKSDFHCDLRGYRYDGTVVWLCIRARPIDFVKSENPVFIASVNDITEQMELQFNNNVVKEKYNILEETANVFLFEYNPRSDRMVLSPGKSKKDIIIDNYCTYLRRGDQIHPDDVNYFCNTLFKTCRKVHKSFFDIRCLNERRDAYCICRIYLSSIADQYGCVGSVVGRIELVSESAEDNGHIIAQDISDDMSCLTGAKTAMKRIHEKIKGNREGSFMVIIDIDDFTRFNLKYGYETGSNAINLAASMVSEIFDGAVIFRYVGDQFVIYIENETETQLYEKVDKLRAAAETITLTGGEDSEFENVSLTFSIGAAWTTNSSDKVNAKDYFITALKALFKAKHQGKNNMVVDRIFY